MSVDRRILANMVRHLQHAPTDPFTPLVDEYLVKRLQRDSPRAKVKIDMRPRYRPGKRLSPSSIGGCQRAATFQFVGIRGTKRVNPDSELIFEQGDWYHHKWQTLFRDMEKVLGKDKVKVLGIEERVQYPKLRIAGNLDLAVRIFIDGEPKVVVIDVKSINERGWAKLVQTAQPVEEHVRQVTTYGVARGEFDLLCLLYENKNTGQVMFFTFSIKKKVWGEVKLWCKEVLKALEQQKIPPMHPECDHGNFTYERCPHKGLCFGNLDRVQIRQMAYKDFPGVDALWERGLAEEDD